MCSPNHDDALPALPIAGAARAHAWSTGGGSARRCAPGGVDGEDPLPHLSVRQCRAVPSSATALTFHDRAAFLLPVHHACMHSELHAHREPVGRAMRAPPCSSAPSPHACTARCLCEAPARHLVLRAG